MLAMRNNTNMQIVQYMKHDTQFQMIVILGSLFLKTLGCVVTFVCGVEAQIISLALFKSQL